MRARWLVSPLPVALVAALIAALVSLGAPVLGGALPAGAASTCTARAFVADNGDSTLSVIDVAIEAVVGAPIAVGAGATRVATSPDGRTVYVTNSDAGTLSVVDAASGTVTGTVTV